MNTMNIQYIYNTTHKTTCTVCYLGVSNFLIWKISILALLIYDYLDFYDYVILHNPGHGTKNVTTRLRFVVDVSRLDFYPRRA